MNSIGSRIPDLAKLAALVARLRAPDGCPWDREQTWSDLRAYLLEEAHEVVDALDREQWPELRGELGDLLFQICFLAQLACEQSRFDLADVVDEIHAKMIQRHPHVFGDARADTAGDVRSAWERGKLRAQGLRAQGLRAEGSSLLGGVPGSLPALVAAFRIGQKAAGVGFDWTAVGEVLAKVEEELDELRSQLADTPNTDLLTEELGDLLFTIASLGRHLGLDPERALALANLKFRRRFAHLETALGTRLHEPATPELRARMEELWEEAKALEKRHGLQA